MGTREVSLASHLFSPTKEKVHSVKHNCPILVQVWFFVVLGVRGACTFFYSCVLFLCLTICHSALRI